MKKAIIFFALVLVLSGFVLADNCPPSLPKTYSGEVFYNSTPLIENYEIRAVIGEDTVGIGVVSGGNYEVDVSPCIGVTGDVKFYINGIGTNEDGSYNGIDDWGKSINLDLSINDLPPTENTCGTPLNVIDLGEECDGINLAGRDNTDCGEGWTGTISCSSNCQIDYSNCVVKISESSSGTSTSGSGSSGGGGGSSGGGISSSSPSIANGTVVLNEQKNNEEKNETVNANFNENQQTANPGILGAVIGFVKSGKGIGLGFALVILVLGGVVFIVQKKKSNLK